jgi:hypothetical protein
MRHYPAALFVGTPRAYRIEPQVLAFPHLRPHDDMTRDNELIRQIILAIKARKDATPQAVEIDGADKAIVARHLEMLLEVGLLEGEKLGALNTPYPTILVKDLSWSGHDLAAVMENEAVWRQFQQKLSPPQLAQIPLPVLKNVGIGLLTTWLKSQF